MNWKVNNMVNSIIGLFFLGLILWLGITVFSTVIVLAFSAIAGVFALIGSLINKMRGV